VLLHRLRAGRAEVQRLFFGIQHAFPMLFTRNHLDRWQRLFNPAPFSGKVKHAP
jgi:hypothetical protein